MGDGRVSLMNIRFDALTERQAVEAIIESWRQGRGGWVSTPNTQQLHAISRSPDLRELVNSASLVVADGMPLVWASALQRTPLPERVAGSNLVWAIAQAAAQVGASVFLLGGEEGVAERAKARLERSVPALKIAGTHCPPLGFENQPAEILAIKDQLSRAKPDFIYVGLGFPKQELLIRTVSADLPQSWFLGIGMSLSFISGDVKRAPVWIQRLGLEWMHRLSREPRRLFRRYVVDGSPFAARLLASSFRARFRGDPEPPQRA